MACRHLQNSMKNQKRIIYKEKSVKVKMFNISLHDKVSVKYSRQMNIRYFSQLKSTEILGTYFASFLLVACIISSQSSVSKILNISLITRLNLTPRFRSLLNQETFAI